MTRTPMATATPPTTDTPRHGWLFVGALEPYKRADLAIAAARQTNTPLTIIGDGSQRKHLQETAPKSVKLLGWTPDQTLLHHLHTAECLLFPQIEDFGITAAETILAHCPVAARAEGGALEVIDENTTGALFNEPTPDALASAARRAAAIQPDTIAHGAQRLRERLHPSRFDQQLIDACEQTIADNRITPR